MDTAREIIDAIQSRHNLTDQALAARVESTQPTIWRIRNGDTKDCAASLYIRLVHLRQALDSPISPDAPNVKAGELGETLESERVA